MSIEFDCHACGKTLRVQEGTGGKKCRCPNCQTQLEIPEEEAVDALAEIACPRCQHTLLYSPDLEGTRGMCKACNLIFTISSDPEIVAKSDGSFPFECPQCHHLFEGKEGMQGKRGRCDQCGYVFEIKPHLPNGDLKTSSVGEIRTISVPAKQEKPKPARSSSVGNRSSIQPTSSRKELPDNSSTGARNGPAKQQNEVVTESESMWDSVSLPNADWTTNAASSSYFGEQQTEIGQRAQAMPGLFGRCFKQAQKNLVMSTLMMLVSYILSSVAMMVMVAIPACILIFLGDTLSVRTWPPYALIIFLIITLIPMLMAFFYFLPSYWVIANRAVRGKEVTFDAITEHADLAPQMFLWAILSSIAPIVICLVLSVVFGGLIIAAASTQNPALIMLVILMFYMTVMFVYFLVATPFMLVPFALIEGASFKDAITHSLTLCFRNAGTFYMLTFTSMFIGILVSTISCGVLSIFGLTFPLMNHAAFYKLTSRRVIG